MSVRKNIEKFSERERLRIFQSKTKTQIAPLAKELDEENQKKIDELYTFAILRSHKKESIRTEAKETKMTDADVDKIVEDMSKEEQYVAAYLINRDV